MAEEPREGEAVRRLQDRFERMARLAREAGRRRAPRSPGGALAKRTDLTARPTIQPSPEQAG